MLRILLTTIVLGMIVSNSTAGTLINGSGATFPSPLYLRWATDFQRGNPGVVVKYQALGSGMGVQQFIDGITDFGVSDVAMSDEEIGKAGGNVLMLPLTAGAIVLPYNIPGVGWGLKLSRKAYIDIFLGKIKSWNDPLITQDNPGLTIPDLPITVIARSDSSGTTSFFTTHLATISNEFATKIGTGRLVSWPCGLAGKGNEGVTELIKKTRGSIGYVEMGYADHMMLTMASLQNKTGHFIHPTLSSGASTLASVELPENLRAFIGDPDGIDDYPIVTFSWMLVRKSYSDGRKAAAIKSFVNYSLTSGQDTAPELGYIPLPASVVRKVQAVLPKIH